MNNRFYSETTKNEDKTTTNDSSLSFTEICVLIEEIITRTHLSQYG